MSAASLGSKRQPDNQSTSFSTPTIEHSSSSQNISKTNIVPIISDIKVYLIENTTSKDGKVWYKSTFSVILSNKKRCKVSLNKEDWLRHQHNGVMEKLCKLIIVSAKLSCLDMSCLLSEPCMNSNLPWKLAWVSSENLVLEKQLQS